MKGKESIIGWVLIMFLVAGFLIYSQKQQKEKLEKDKKELSLKNDSLNPPDNIKTTENFVDSSSKAAIDSTGLSSVSSNTANDLFITSTPKTYTIENEVLKLTINSKGGWVESANLKKYKTWDGKPLFLFNAQNQKFDYSFPVKGDRIIKTSDLNFRALQDGFNIKGDETKTFSLRAETTQGGFIEHRFTLKGNSYEVAHDLNINGLTNVIASNTTNLEMNWNSSLPRLEQNIGNERRYASIYLKNKNGDVEHLSQEESEEKSYTTSIDWIAFKHQFFTTAIFPKTSFSNSTVKVTVDPKDESYMKKYDARTYLAYNPKENNSFSFNLFLGPSHYKTMKDMDNDFENVLHLGPDFWMFSWIKYITKFVFIPLFNFFDKYHLNYGIIILIMTLMLKIVLHPLTYKSLESAAKMKVLQPELQELRDKYQNDQAKLGSEQMALYGKAGVSPFGGCLPLLLQFPILMAMYYFFPSSIELRQQSFLWATDLSSYDSIWTFNTMIPLIGNHISLFTLLMTLTSLVQAWQNSGMNQMNTQPGMQYFPYIMPVFLMFMFNNFPAALTYYYLLQNLLGVIHQWIIQKFFINEEKLHRQIQENKKKPKEKSGFQKKLDEMMKEAEKRQKSSKK